MKALILASAAMLMTGCTAQQEEAALSDLDAACQAEALASAGLDSALHGGALDTANQVIAPADAFCAIVKNGQVPANADSNSVKWLGDITTTVSTVKALAQ